MVPALEKVVGRIDDALAQAEHCIGKGEERMVRQNTIIEELGRADDYLHGPGGTGDPADPCPGVLSR